MASCGVKRYKGMAMCCSKCGVAISEGSNFCQKCGSPVTANSISGLEILKPDYSDPLASLQKPSIGISDALATYPLAKYLLCLLACFYGIVIFPAFWGIPFDSKQYGGILMIVSGSIVAYIWNKRNKSVWAGAAVGVAFAVLVNAISAFAIGLVFASAR